MHNTASSVFRTGDIPAWEDFLACLPPNWREVMP